MTYQRGTCRECGTPNVLIVNRTHWLCDTCNQGRLGDNKASGKAQSRFGADIPPTGTSKPTAHKNGNGSQDFKKRKPTGEALMFLVASEKNPHVCYVCGRAIRPITYASCAHVLPKGKYPKFRLYDKNCVFLCPPMDGCRAHYRYDFEPHSTLKDLPEWKALFDLREILLLEYRQLELNETN